MKTQRGLLSGPWMRTCSSGVARSENIGPSSDVSTVTSAIVSSIVGLGQSLHVTITAEGVENESQAAMLKKWGCDQVQGFYYGRPEAEVESEESDKPADRPLVA